MKRVSFTSPAEEGLTLPELVVVLVIISVLVSLGLSRYNLFTAKARQAEAKVNLRQLYDLNEMYKLEHGAYKGLPTGGIGNAGVSNGCKASKLKNELGYRPNRCENLRYLYQHGSGTTAFRFTADAEGTVDKTRVYPGCTDDDQWSINQDMKLVPHATKDVLKTC